MTPLC